MKPCRAGTRARPSWRPIPRGLQGFAAAVSRPRLAPAAGEPIRIGVVAEVSTLRGAASPGGCQTAVYAINVKGGPMGRPLERAENAGLKTSGPPQDATPRIVPPSFVKLPA